MSVRPLDEDKSSGGDSGADTIRSIADTKGVDIDEIEVESGSNDDGQQYKQYRVYETKAESEEDSVGVQIQKMVDSPLGEQTFRQEVQRKLSALKQHVSTGGDGDVDVEARTPDPDDSDTDADTGQSRSRQRQSRQPPQQADGVLIDPSADGVDITIEIDASEYDSVDALIRESDSYGALDRRLSKVENALEKLGEMFKIPNFGDEE